MTGNFDPEGKQPIVIQQEISPYPYKQMPAVGDTVLIVAEAGSTPVPAIVLFADKTIVDLLIHNRDSDERRRQIPYGHNRGEWHWRPSDVPNLRK